MRASWLAVASGIVAVVFTVVGCLAIVASPPINVIGAALAGAALAFGLYLGQEAVTGAALVIAAFALIAGGVADGSGPAMSALCLAVVLGAARICMDARRPALVATSTRRRLVTGPATAAGFGVAVAIAAPRLADMLGNDDTSAATASRWLWLVPVSVVVLALVLFVRPSDRASRGRPHTIVGALLFAAALVVVMGATAAQQDESDRVTPGAGETTNGSDDADEPDSAGRVSGPSTPPELPDHLAALIVIALGMAVLGLLRKTLFAEQPIDYEPSAPEGEGELSLLASEAIHQQGDYLAADTARRVLTDAVGDLDAIADPRLAVRAAYATLERGFADTSHHRRPHESEREYLARLHPHLRAAPNAMEGLTRLFERARFSTAPIDDRHRTEAAGALRDLQQNFADADAGPAGGAR